MERIKEGIHGGRNKVLSITFLKHITEKEDPDSQGNIGLEIPGK